MVIYGFRGPIRTGKTLAMVHQAYIDYKNGHEIASNIHLSFPHTYISTLEELEELRGNIAKPKKLLLDEIWRWIDSRCTRDKKVTAISAICKYSGKRGIDIYWTSQFVHQVEKRIRDETVFVFVPEKADMKKISLGIWKEKLRLAGWEEAANKLGHAAFIELPNRIVLNKLDKTGKLIDQIVLNDCIFTMTLYDTTEEVDNI